jgi:hypothetical protein
MCETERETAPPPGEMIALSDRRCRDACPLGGYRSRNVPPFTVTYDDGVTAADLLTLLELQPLRARFARRRPAGGWRW